MSFRAIHGIEWCDKITAVDSIPKTGVTAVLGVTAIICAEDPPENPCNAILLKRATGKCVDPELGPCNQEDCFTFYSNQSNICLLNVGDYIYDNNLCNCAPSEPTPSYPQYFSNKGCVECQDDQIACFEISHENCRIIAKTTCPE